jgi:predicted PurR-regulated permease PerM
MDNADNTQMLERKAFNLFLFAITSALVFVTWPLASALLCSVLAAIMFQPLYRRLLLRLNGRETRASLATLIIITVAVVIPLLIIGGMVTNEAADLYLLMRTREFDASIYFMSIHDALPLRLQSFVDASGYGRLSDVQAKIASLLSESAGFIAQYALSVGSNALSFVLAFGVGLYVTYFLLRDGGRLVDVFERSLPFENSISIRLTTRFTEVVRATIKGSVVVGIVQGILGAITFAIADLPSVALFGVLMAIASLLPAVGPALIWAPAAVYLILTGDIWQAIVVIVSGFLVIGMADNVLRPVLVGRSTGIPDWVVLVTTLGGIATFGLSGIVLGPVIAGLFMCAWEISREQRETVNSSS